MSAHIPYTRLEVAALSIAGTIAFGIGATILSVPHTFYASYGITVGTDPNLLSELRAPGAGLAAMGLLMIAGLIRSWLRTSAKLAALIVYVAFPIGRIVSWGIDGMPSTAIAAALALEIAVAVLCVIAFRPVRAEQVA